jgi:hypothetical protein
VPIVAAATARVAMGLRAIPTFSPISISPISAGKGLLTPSSVACLEMISTMEIDSKNEICFCSLRVEQLVGSSVTARSERLEHYG